MTIMSYSIMSPYYYLRYYAILVLVTILLPVILCHTGMVTIIMTYDNIIGHNNYGDHASMA